MANKIQDVKPKANKRYKSRVSVGTSIDYSVVTAAKEFSKDTNIPLSKMIDEALTIYLANHGIDLDEQQTIAL